MIRLMPLAPRPEEPESSPNNSTQTRTDWHGGPAMNRALIFTTLFVCLSATAGAQTPAPARKAQPATPAAPIATSQAAVQAARASFAKLPLSFEENVGQTDARVKYTTRGSGYNVFLTADEAVFAL